MRLPRGVSMLAAAVTPAGSAPRPPTGLTARSQAVEASTHGGPAPLAELDRLAADRRRRRRRDHARGGSGRDTTRPRHGRHPRQAPTSRRRLVTKSARPDLIGGRPV